MKSVIALCVCWFAALALARPGEDHYTDRFDNLDVDSIISNKKLLDNYIKCVLDQGKCTAEGKELREHIKDALETECSKCTEAQKKSGKRVIKHLINHEEGYWNELTAKYDPDRKYTTKYEKELSEAKE